MDEPLSTLDEELNMQLRQETTARRFGIYARLCHRADEAKHIGTRTIYLKRGRMEGN
jgi:ABC-type sugar transport system ATPase subunit